MKSFVSLNFSSDEKKHLIKVLHGLTEFEQLPVASDFEEMRCKALNSVLVLYKTGKVLIQGKDAETVKEFFLSKLNLSTELSLGFDEAGRGEESGVLTIAGVLADKNLLRELRDSKKIKKASLQEKKDFVTKNALAYNVTVFSPQLIDECRGKGINLNELECRAIKAVSEIFSFKKDAHIIIDGAPLNQCKTVGEFLPKGDDLNTVISASSVLAKYAREQSKNKEKRKSWKIREKN